MNFTADKFRILIVGASAMMSAVGGQAALAQDKGADALSLEEIVVTARRTEEKLLDVPLAVTAFSAEDIEARGIRNLDDIAAATPGVTFSNLLGEFLPTPIIRGVAPVNVFGENNAAIFIDGVYVSGREGLNFSLLDLESIDVVKGPQSALFGRNAFSGAINYVTAKPSQELVRKAEVQVGNRGKKMLQGSISGSLSDTVAARVAVAYDTWDGSYDNQVAGGPDIGGYEYKTAQASLRFTPSDSFEGLVSIYYSDDEIDPSAMSQVLANCEDRLLANVTPMQTSSKWLNYCGELPSVNKDSLSVPIGTDGEDRELVRSQLHLKWNFGAGTLTSLTGYSKVEQFYLVDGTRGDGTTTFAYAAAAPSAFTPRPIRTFESVQIQKGMGDITEEISQELRFSSPEDRSVRWAAGAYFYKTDKESSNRGVISSPLPADFGALCPCIIINPMANLGFPTPGASLASVAAFMPWFLDPVDGAAYPRAVASDIQAYSAFGSIDIDLTERLTARLEARWTDETKEVQGFDSTGVRQMNFKDSWSIPNWRANLRFKPNPDWTVYGSVAGAEKSGDFATAGVNFVGDPPNTPQVQVGRPYDPEKNLSYELGAKGRLAGGRVQLEADVYYIDWSDIVIPQIFEEINGRQLTTPTSFETNGGDATLKGFEFSVLARLTKGLTVNAALSLADGTYDNGLVQTYALFPSFPNGDISGKKLLRASDKQASVGFTYEAPLGERFVGYVRSDYAYRGEQYADSVNQTSLPAQGLLNASIGLRGDNWTVELWGRNLTHEDAPSGAFRDVVFSNYAPNLAFGGAASLFPFRWTVTHPRLTTYGLTARVKF
ncbi:MAG: TonB-dependent receptor [Sinobacteraceae bacterium]|nr:TonB-dependent receptor [Nevskiaceae bacterium]